jgi:RNA polymerase sigma factor (sigma-70 family)
MTATTSIKIEALSFGRAQASLFIEDKPGLEDWDRDFFNSEAFVALMEGLADYDDKRDNQGVGIVTFLRFRIQNRLKNAVRKESEVVGQVPVMVRDGKKQSESKIGFEYVMEKLEPRDRKIFYLYYVEDNTLETIGRILGISTGRVHQVLQGRIKRRVKEILDGEGNSPKIQ